MRYLPSVSIFALYRQEDSQRVKVMKRPISFEQQEVRRWIKGICRDYDIKSTHLAKLAGVAPSTLNRFLNDKEHQYVLSAKTIGKVEKAVASLPDNMQLSDQLELSGERLIVVGEVAAGVFKTALEWPVNEQFAFSLPPIPIFEGCRKFGLIVRGESMNQLYKPGTILICVKFIDLERDPQDGEKVIVERTDKHGMTEATVKEYRIQNGEAWLWPKSTAPEFQTPWRVADHNNQEEEDSLVIKSLVVWSMRPE